MFQPLFNLQFIKTNGYLLNPTLSTQRNRVILPEGKNFIYVSLFLWGMGWDVRHILRAYFRYWFLMDQSFMWKSPFTFTKARSLSRTAVRLFQSNDLLLLFCIGTYMVRGSSTESLFCKNMLSDDLIKW